MDIILVFWLNKLSPPLSWKPDTLRLILLTQHTPYLFTDAAEVV